jgi:hypothetical protein
MEMNKEELPKHPRLFLLLRFYDEIPNTILW